VIVADANIIAYWLIEGEFTESARRLRSVESVWAVPTLCRHELLNVLVSYVQHGGMGVDDAQLLWGSAEAFLGSNEYEVNLSAVIPIATEYDISAYDAQYVALAHELGVPLVTEDKRLRRQTPNFVFSIKEYQNSYSQKNG